MNGCFYNSFNFASKSTGEEEEQLSNAMIAGTRKGMTFKATA